MDDRRDRERGGQVPGRDEPEPAPLRPAVVMVAVGAVLAAAGLLVPDERWQLVTWIVGGMTGVSGLLTLGYSRVERNAPLERLPWRR